MTQQVLYCVESLIFMQEWTQEKNYGRLGPSPCTTDAGPAPSGIAPAHDSTDVLLAELDAGRLAAEEFARLGRAAGMPEAAVTEVLRSLVCASK